MTQQVSPSEVTRIFDAELSDMEPVPARFNCAPTDPLTVVVQRDEGRLVERHRWGLITAWTDHPRAGAPLINARAETVATSKAFRVAFQRRRCIVPADGFYEWQRGSTSGRGNAPQPWLIRRSDGAPMAMAGVWSTWRDPDSGRWRMSCAVVTTTAAPLLMPLHDRMPVLLDADMWSLWLDSTESPVDLLHELTVRDSAGELELFPVSRLVNDVHNE